MASIKEVAKLAGVSVITVSRVINTPNLVKPATISKVNEAMEELNYSPNPVAKALVSGKTNVIDVYIPGHSPMTEPYVMHLIAGISEVLSKNMYSFLIIRDYKVEHTCDGYITTGLFPGEFEDMYNFVMERNRKMVLFGHTEFKNIDYVDVDNVDGIYIATKHHIENNHEKIAMINIDLRKDYTKDRKMGYQRAMTEIGKYSEQHIFETDNSADGGAEAVKQFLAGKDYTAVVCASDAIAVGVVRAYKELGISIPEDVSVTGYDGLGIENLTSPVITTVTQPFFEIGKLMAETLLKRIEHADQEPYVRRLIKPQLVIGESVKKLNS